MKKKANQFIRPQHAFTLVELSIVLVILGLLVGGVLAGQSLIRASELRAVTVEQQRYVTAVNAFRDKYFMLPGDMTNATSFWSGTANGNGDSMFNTAAGGNVSGEAFQFWNHLSLAGLIEGKYTGLSGTGGAQDSVIGTNVPRSKLSNAGWSLYYFGFAGDTRSYNIPFGNILIFGASLAGDVTNANVIKSEEAWNVDTKVDDGKPGTGRIIARENATWSGSSSAKCTTSTTNSDYAGNYNLNAGTVNCSLYFTQTF